MAFHSKTHWEYPGVVIAFEPTWNLISNSSLENAELGNCCYSQIHVGEPSVRGETVYLAFLEPQLRHELSNVLDGMCWHNLWVICQVSCRPPVPRKLRNTCLSISKVFIVVGVGSTLHPRGPTRVQQIRRDKCFRFHFTSSPYQFVHRESILHWSKTVKSTAWWSSKI